MRRVKLLIKLRMIYYLPNVKVVLRGGVINITSIKTFPERFTYWVMDTQ
jgi:hypothetical protein